jgi:hypothetical protein
MDFREKMRQKQDKFKHLENIAGCGVVIQSSKHEGVDSV